MPVLLPWPFSRQVPSCRISSVTWPLPPVWNRAYLERTPVCKPHLSEPVHKEHYRHPQHQPHENQDLTGHHNQEFHTTREI